LLADAGKECQSIAARDPGGELAGLPEFEVTGLGDSDARALLASALAGPLDERVRDLIVAETRGNPLALLELPRGLTPAELAGGFGLPGAAPLAGAIEDSFARPIPPVNGHWCGGRPGGWASQSRPAHRRWRPGWSSSAAAWVSGIRWCARRPTGRRRWRTGSRCTRRWQR
jgi:hypothetical protein